MTDIKVAKELLRIKAVFLRPNDPFTWASGIKSPIYCDNRLILTDTEARKVVEEAIAKTVKEKFPEVEVLMGTSTAGIAHAAIAGWLLDLPMGYVRSGNKDHGRGNQIEGRLDKGNKVVVIEDLVSTGGSSLKTVEILQNYGSEVIGMTCLFNYKFPVAVKRFHEANINLISLCDYSTMLEVAEQTNYISPQEAETLREWRKDPASWMPDFKE